MSSFPALPQIDDPTIIRLVDVVREGEVIVGLVVAALLVRSLLRLPDNLRPLVQLKGYKMRVLALIVGLVLLALQSYSRIGQPVVIGIFPLGVIFVGMCAYALHLGMTHPAPTSETEERLASFDPPKWSCPPPDGDEEQPG